MGDLRHTLASFWSDETDRQEHFLCTGVFVAPALVLTVKHIFEKRAAKDVWIRPLADNQPYPIKGEPIQHPEKDAALVRIEHMPPYAKHAQVDRALTHRPIPNAYLQLGYFEARDQTPRQVSVEAYVAAKDWYRTHPRHQQGYSGAPLFLDGRLWGMVNARYIDKDGPGCAIAMHQLWDGFLEIELGKVGAATVQEDFFKSHSALLQEMREKMGELFDADPFRSWRAAQPIEKRLPKSITDALDGDERGQGGRAVISLTRLAEQLKQSMDEGDFELSPGQKRKARSTLMRCMGIAARLCLNPEQAVLLAQAGSRLNVPAVLPEGAMIAHRQRPEEGWPQRPGHGMGRALDQYTHEFSVECGELGDKVNELASLIASMRSSENPTEEKVRVDLKDQTPANSVLHRWRTYFQRERKAGRGRFLVLGNQQTLDDRSAELLDFFGVSVLKLLGDTSGLFWFDETELLGEVRAFLRALEPLAEN